jgi:hypothetical protein
MVDSICPATKNDINSISLIAVHREKNKIMSDGGGGPGCFSPF